MVVAAAIIIPLAVGGNGGDKNTTYSLTVVSDNAEHGTVSDNTGSYEAGTSITIIATAKDGYELIGWYNGDTKLSGDAEYTFTMPESNITYTAKWDVDSALNAFDYEVTASGYALKGVKDNTATSITIPDYIVDVAPAMLAGCTNLESISLPANISLYKMLSAEEFEGGVAVPYWSDPEAEEPEMYFMPSTLAKLTISSGEIPDRAYIYNEVLEEILLGDGVTGIGRYAFEGCENVTSITLPSNITKINDGAFSGCALTELNLPATVTEIAEYAFSGSALTELTIPSTITKIGKCAFASSDNLLNVVVPDSVTTIGDGAFRCCNGLKSITLPSGITSIPAEMFEMCRALQSFTIPESVTSIGDWAFSECESLESMVIPDTVTSLGERVFQGCGSLKSVTLPKDITVLKEALFVSCRSLESVNIPENLTEIGEGVFSGCNKLPNITIPSTVLKIGPSAFNCCSSFTTIVIPESVTEIGSCLFTDCVALENVTLPSSLEKIPGFMFSGCSALKEIKIPEKVTSIGDCAFRYCTSLESVIMPNTVTEIVSHAFRTNGTAFKTLYYCGSEDDWKSISIGDSGNNILTADVIYYYSETNPFEGENAVTDGNFWHYDGDGKAVIWVKPL